MKPLSTFLLLALSTLISTQALAHSSHVASGFMNGLAHPFTGADHLITLLLAGALIARLFAGQIKTAITTLGLLMSVYIWTHGTSMTEMNSNFMFGFLCASSGLIALAFFADKLMTSAITKRKHTHA